MVKLGPPPSLRITQAEYARHRGVSQAAVRKAVRSGRITLGADGLLDPAVADVQWRRNTRVRAVRAAMRDPQARAAGPSPATWSAPAHPHNDGDDYAGARARRECAEAALAELRLAEERGELVRVDVVRAALAAVLAATRESLLQLPARLSVPFAAERDVHRIREQFDAELVQALEQLAGSPDRIGAKR